LLIESKAGEILKVTPKNEGGRPADKTSADQEPVSTAPILADLGVTKKESSRLLRLGTFRRVVRSPVHALRRQVYTTPLKEPLWAAFKGVKEARTPLRQAVQVIPSLPMGGQPEEV
jgi:hypothetical protein